MHFLSHIPEESYLKFFEQFLGIHHLARQITPKTFAQRQHFHTQIIRFNDNHKLEEYNLCNLDNLDNRDKSHQ